MRINKVEILKLALPMIKGLRLSSIDVEEKETVIIKLHTDDGLVGYGESSSTKAPMLFNNENNDITIRVLKGKIAPKIIGRSFDTPEEFAAAYAGVSDGFAVRAGVECAFWHLAAQRDKKSLKELFGGVKSEIAVGESIGIKPSLTETLQEIEARLAEGYLRIKLKIKPGWDTELIKAVRRQWPDIELTVDANEAYDFGEQAELLRSMDAYGLSMIEQPFGAGDFSGHAALQKQISTPICLDESIRSVGDLEKCVQIGACRILNIKPARVGGILESIRLHDYAAAHNIGLMCGGMLETGIGRAFNIALASKVGFNYPADMSPYQLYFEEDLIDPSYIVKPNGHIDVPDKPGIGYAIRDDLVDKYAIYRAVI